MFLSREALFLTALSEIGRFGCCSQIDLRSLRSRAHLVPRPILDSRVAKSSLRHISSSLLLVRSQLVVLFNVGTQEHARRFFVEQYEQEKKLG
jgi:hypothetical protein